MKIETLEDLERLLDLCQRRQVHTMQVDGLSFQMALAVGSAAASQGSEAEAHPDLSWGDDLSVLRAS